MIVFSYRTGTEEEEKACKSFFDSLKLLPTVNFIAFNANDPDEDVDVDPPDEYNVFKDGEGHTCED